MDSETVIFSVVAISGRSLMSPGVINCHCAAAAAAAASASVASCTLSRNDTDLARHNFNSRPPVKKTIFDRNVAERE